ncbi:hypothetical protein ACOSP7_011696 [Xanthoceras sorbifolium]
MTPAKLDEKLPTEILAAMLAASTSPQTTDRFCSLAREKPSLKAKSSPSSTEKAPTRHLDKAATIEPLLSLTTASTPQKGDPSLIATSVLSFRLPRGGGT